MEIFPKKIVIGRFIIVFAVITTIFSVFLQLIISRKDSSSSKETLTFYKSLLKKEFFDLKADVLSSQNPDHIINVVKFSLEGGLFMGAKLILKDGVSYQFKREKLKPLEMVPVIKNLKNTKEIGVNREAFYLNERTQSVHAWMIPPSRTPIKSLYLVGYLPKKSTSSGALILLSLVEKVLLFGLFSYMVRRLMLSPLRKLMEAISHSCRKPRNQALTRFLPEPRILTLYQLTGVVRRMMADLAKESHLVALNTLTSRYTENCHPKEFFLSVKMAWEKNFRPCPCFLALVEKTAEHYFISMTSDVRVSYQSSAIPSHQVLEKKRTQEPKIVSEENLLSFVAEGIKRKRLQTADLFLLKLKNEKNIIFAVQNMKHYPHGMREMEKLIFTWLGRVSEFYQKSLLKDIAGQMALTSELRKTYIGAPPEQDSYIRKFFAFEHMPNQALKGDFLVIQASDKAGTSLSILGDVAGRDMRSSLTAMSLTSILGQHYKRAKSHLPEVMMEDLARTVEDYLLEIFGSELSCSYLGVYFDHSSGQGLMNCFGAPFPMVSSARDRKPFAVAPTTIQGPLGIGVVEDFSPTNFSLLKGQTLFACTDGLLNTRDNTGKSFERVIQRGALADIIELSQEASAEALLTRFIEKARQYAGGTPFQDDVTVVILTGK